MRFADFTSSCAANPPVGDKSLEGRCLLRLCFQSVPGGIRQFCFESREGSLKVRDNLHAHLFALAAFIGFVILATPWVPRHEAMAATASAYHRVAKVTLGGEGFWDYLAMDAGARRLYISRWTHVMVVDADSYRVVGDIPSIEGVHGIAIAREFGRGFISEDEANRVTIFDLKTWGKIGSAKTGQNPDAVIYDPAAKRVFAFSGHDGTATAIDAASGNVVGTVNLGGSPEFAAADRQGHIYNNLE